MIDYVYGHDEVVAHFVAQLIPSCRERGLPKASKSIGVIEMDEQGEGQLIAGLVYHNWDPDAGTIEVSCAAIPGKRWLTRQTIRRIYEYPFEQLGCQMLYGRVDADNEQLLRQLAALNYSLIRIPRMLGRDRDGVLTLLTVEDWQANAFSRRDAKFIKPRVERDVIDVSTREAA